MAFLKLHPFDEVGLSKNRPSTESKFTKLTNLITLDGRLRFRPGFVHVGPDNYDIDSKNVEWGIPILIDEVANTGGFTLSDRPGSERAAETLRPDASTTLVAGWTGDYSDIDEVVPDGVDYLESSTALSKQQVGFADLSTTYDGIYGIVIRGRARQNQPGGTATLNVYYADTTTLIDSVTIYAEIYSTSVESEADYWQNFAIPLYLHPADLTPFTNTSVNAFSIALAHGGGSTNADQFEYLAIAGDGDYSDWVGYKTERGDPDTGATASYTDFDSRIIDDIDEDDEFATLSMTDVVAGTDAQHSFTVGTLYNTYTTVTKATMRLWLGNFGYPANSRVSLYFRTGGVDYLVDTKNIDRGGLPPKGTTVEFEMAANPATSTAWTNATLNGSEWVIKREDGRPVLMGGDLKVQGNVESIPTIQIDNVAVDVYPVNDPLPDRLIVSTKNYFLLEGDDDDFTNVQGDATATAVGGVPHDSAVLYGQIYMVDGTTTRRYPNNPSDSDWEDLTDNDGLGTGKISGRTVAAFADRILYGWVADAGDTTPERVAYSKEFNGGTHNDNSAGDFDVLITPGGVVCLEPLNDDLCACYKETGIFILRRTGFSFAPIVPDPIDMETSLVAEATVKSASSPTGDPIHLFLGRNPKGINVFQFDGINTTPIGDGIAPALRDNINKAVEVNSFAEIDPVGGFYRLFIPEGTQLYPEQAYVMNLKTGVWTRAEFPWPVPVAGRWTLRNITDDPNGERKMILGLGDNLPYKTDYSSGHDILHPPAGGSTSEFYEAVSTGVTGPKRGMISGVIETGDWGSPDGDVLSWDPKRLHLWYYDQGPYEVSVQWSKDGGKNFVTANTYWIGSPDNDGGLRYEVLEFPDPESDDDSPNDARKIMFKVTLGNDDDAYSTYPDIPEAVIEWEPGGEN